MTQTSDAIADRAVPSHVPEELVHEFDHWSDPAYLADPWAFWDAMRDRFRVFWSPRLGGFWCVTRFDDVDEVMRTPALAFPVAT